MSTDWPGGFYHEESAVVGSYDVALYPEGRDVSSTPAPTHSRTIKNGYRQIHLGKRIMHYTCITLSPTRGEYSAWEDTPPVVSGTVVYASPVLFQSRSTTSKGPTRSIRG